GLRTRLRRRGVMVASGALAAALLGLSQQAAAAVPEPLVRTTLRTAMRFGAGPDGGASDAPARVVDLAEWGAKSLSGRGLRTAVALLVLLGLLGAVGALLLRHRPPEEPVPRPQPAEGPIQERLKGTWTVTRVIDGGVPAPRVEGQLIFTDD